jgi:hypothetical protein
MSLVLMKNTQHMLRYAFAAGAEAPADNTLTQAKLVADAAAGPLKARLASVLSPTEWIANDLNTVANRTPVRDFCVYIIPNGPGPAAASYSWTQSGGVNVLQLASDAAGGTFVVEIWYAQSMHR